MTPDTGITFRRLLRIAGLSCCFPLHSLRSDRTENACFFIVSRLFIVAEIFLPSRYQAMALFISRHVTLSQGMSSLFRSSLYQMSQIFVPPKNLMRVTVMICAKMHVRLLLFLPYFCENCNMSIAFSTVHQYRIPWESGQRFSIADTRIYRYSETSGRIEFRGF
jgi:hypothetical protein